MKIETKFIVNPIIGWDWGSDESVTIYIVMKNGEYYSRHLALEEAQAECDRRNGKEGD